MTSVENTLHKPIVKIGYGTRPQEATLRTAGVERVIIHPDGLASMIDFAGMAARAGDVLVFVQPTLLSAGDYKLLQDACAGDLAFQVVGHDGEFLLKSAKSIREFRKIKAQGIPDATIVEATGRPAYVAKPTWAQADALINLWHQVPKLSHDDIEAQAKAILNMDDDAPLRSTWVRDLVKKHVGTAKRARPDDWHGLMQQGGSGDAD